MKSRIPAVITALAILLASPQAAESKLPGARAVIEAVEYPSLQAAIDAVPRDGGTVRLPRGEFVITQPLIIRHEDFRMGGAGAGIRWQLCVEDMRLAAELKAVRSADLDHQ